MPPRLRSAALEVGPVIADIILINSDEEKLWYVVHYGFQASNYEAEHEVVIVMVELAQSWMPKTSNTL